MTAHATAAAQATYPQWALSDVTVREASTGTTSVLHTTEHHPFWDATDRRWMPAGRLAPGHRLLTHDAKRLEGDSTGAGVGGGGPGADTVVVGVRTFAGTQTMHDLTVADTHTYHVVAGDTPVLVHNCGGRHASGETAPDSDYVGRHRDPYAGVKEASEFLRNAGVPRAHRKSIIESFEVGTINVRAAGDNEFGMRLYDGVNAQARGGYLMPNLPATREEIAVLPRWNQFSGLA